MKYTRLYADSDGETHFEDVEVELAQGTVTSGSNPGGMSNPRPTSGSFFASYDSPAFADYHPTPRKQWFVVLSGIGEFGASDGEVRRLEPGNVVLLDDMDSKGHTARVLEPCTVMFIGLEE
jgi:hypothetical protein